MQHKSRPGPPLTKGGAVSKEAKKFAQFLRDWERDYHWSILCLQEFTASKGDVVIETAEGHRVLAKPACKGQRRLAIAVATEILPFLIGSFCVKGRNCALDDCWDGKKFRVICSHLNPLSVMHLYVKDLDDLRSMVTSRGRNSHVHTCGHSDKLGDNAAKTIQRKRWYCSNCYTSCRKNKEYSRVSSWRISSQPQTLTT